MLCFPGIFRGALDVRAREITEEMKMAAARGIAAVVGDDELREDHIIPSPFNRDVPPAVAAAVAEQAKREGSAGRRPRQLGYAPGDTQEFGARPARRRADDHGDATGRFGSLIGRGADATRGDEVTVAQP